MHRKMSINRKKSYSCGTVSDKDFRFRRDARSKNRSSGRQQGRLVADLGANLEPRNYGVSPAGGT